MKRAKFMEEQTIGVLRQESGAKTFDLARKYGVAEAAITGRPKFGGMDVSEAERLR